MTSEAAYYLLCFCGLTGFGWVLLICDHCVVIGKWQLGVESSEDLTRMDVQDDSLVAGSDASEAVVRSTCCGFSA